MFGLRAEVAMVIHLHETESQVEQEFTDQSH